MADLRTLLYTDAGEVVVPDLREVMIANTSESAGNGGACCCWCIPEGTSYIKLQIWGGGGGGAGGCCCMQGRPGGSGAYVQKTLTGSQVVPGTYICICAGGSTSSAPSNDGCVGCHSRAIGCNISMCARGGYQGCSGCRFYQNCYMCQLMCYNMCCAEGGDFHVNGTRGNAYNSQYCIYNGSQFAPVAPGTISGPIVGPSGCSCIWCCSGYNASAVFPGGGGLTAQVFGGGCRCGNYGAAGAVTILYG
jgi:hypothetical protein